MGGAKVHLHALGLGSGLVAELDQRHQHGQAKTAHKDVEDSGHVGQAQSLRRLVLRGGGRERRGRSMERKGEENGKRANRSGG